MNKELDELIMYIKNSSSYKNCLLIKEKMSSNDEICKLISDVKNLQKKYVRSNYQDSKIKQELDLKQKRLLEIPIYVEYNNNLEEVNRMINLVKDELNDYFSKIVSIDIEDD